MKMVNQDEEHLKLLSILHYVWGGLTGFGLGRGRRDGNKKKYKNPGEFFVHSQSCWTGVTRFFKMNECER